MFEVHCVYSDGLEYIAYDITKITFQSSDGLKELTEDGILNTDIPLVQLYLHGNERNYTICSDNLRQIQIIKKGN